MSRRVLYAALLLIGPAATPSAAQVTYGRATLPTRTALGNLRLERAWYTILPLETGPERILRTSLAGTRLFVQTDQANLHAYDAETGRYLWHAKIGRPTDDARPVSVNSSLAFVTNLHELYALDLATGKLVWRKGLEAEAASATAANEDEVCVGLENGKVVAYLTHEKKDVKPIGRSAGAFLWAWQTNKTVSSRPIPAERVIAFGSQDGRVYVAMTEPPTLLYRFRTSGPISASIATYGTRTLIVPSEDFNLYAIDLYTGQKKWSYATGAPIKNEPLVSGEDIFALNDAGTLTSVHAKTGELEWNLNIGRARPIGMSGTRIYLVTRDGHLAIVDRQNGRAVAMPHETFTRAGLDLREFTILFMNRENDRLYLTNPSGVIVCLREAGRVQPVPHHDPKAPPFGFVPRDGEQPTPPAVPPADTAAAAEEKTPADEPAKKDADDAPEKGAEPKEKDEEPAADDEAPGAKPK